MLIAAKQIKDKCSHAVMEWIKDWHSLDLLLFIAVESFDKKLQVDIHEKISIHSKREVDKELR